MAHLKNALHRGWSDVIKSKLNQPNLIPNTNFRQILLYYVLPPFPIKSVLLNLEVAPKWCCDSSPAADPELGVSGAGGVGGGPPVTPQGPKTGRLKKMVRLAAELLLLLGLLLLTLHITVLRSSPLHQGNFTLSQDQQDTLLAEVSAIY